MRSPFYSTAISGDQHCIYQSGRKFWEVQPPARSWHMNLSYWLNPRLRVQLRKRIPPAFSWPQHIAVLLHLRDCFWQPRRQLGWWCACHIFGWCESSSLWVLFPHFPKRGKIGFLSWMGVCVSVCVHLPPLNWSPPRTHLLRPSKLSLALVIAMIALEVGATIYDLCSKRKSMHTDSAQSKLAQSTADQGWCSRSTNAQTDV